MSSVALSEAQQAQRKKEESKAVTKAARKIKKRQSIGDDWDSKRSANNINWPLATALIREGNQELLKAAMFYRKVEAQAHSNPLIGGTAPNYGDMQVDRRMFVRGNGQISYAEEKKCDELSVRPSSGTRAKKADDRISPDKIKAPIRGPWKGDHSLLAKMDAERAYEKLSSLIGAYLEPFEDLVCDNLTYEQVGNKMRVGSNAAGARAAAQAVAHLGLIAIRDARKIEKKDLI